jgi:hypothetical protein
VAARKQESIIRGRLRKSAEVGRRALSYVGRASWWKWDAGLYPFFWRWPEEFQKEIRDGLAPRFRDVPPRCEERQRVNPDPEVRKKEKEKKVINFGYLIRTCWEGLKSLMHFFSVTKGDNDIRMVYNRTKNGLNLVTWIPWFAIPSSATLERMVVPGSVQADNDYEDMFLNFKLHEELQAYTGVDVRGLYKDEGEGDDALKYVTWDRPAMGLTGSPYTCVQGACRGKRVALGDRTDQENVFRWESVIVNLPGTWDYDPTRPRIYKTTSEGNVAADLVIYIDDVRAVANSLADAWKASSRAAKTCAWLGLQDAARKRREPSTKPGAWAGTVM